MTQYKTNYPIIISMDLGCAYRLTDGVLEWNPLMNDGTFDLNEFSPVEPELVGDEQCTFENTEMTLNDVYKIVTERLENAS